MWRCELIEESKSPLFKSLGVWKAGCMWYAEFLLEQEINDSQISYYRDFMLSDEYREDWMDLRPPIFILLPCGDYWNVDARIEANPLARGWKIRGWAPSITATPFISCRNHYEGWLYNGVLTDDMKHRKYPPFVKRVEDEDSSRRNSSS